MHNDFIPLLEVTTPLLSGRVLKREAFPTDRLFPPLRVTTPLLSGRVLKLQGQQVAPVTGMQLRLYLGAVVQHDKYTTSPSVH